jgi:hypothetical protein
MPFLHIANTNFESELEGKPQMNPIFLQLQFLPLLYAGKEDGIGVTHAPVPSFCEPKWHLLDENKFPYSEVKSWGASPTIATWAKKHHLTFAMPPWDVVQAVNSKAFSFTEAPKLPGAALIHSWEELQQWDAKMAGPKVLKSCFGVSGRGHLFLPSDRMKKFAETEFLAGRPLIAEPWVERKLDFSTQWVIHPDRAIEFIGPTICISNKRGSYAANEVGDLPLLAPYLEKHQEIVTPILHKMAKLGYFGNVGIDAMVWGNDLLQPVVEINARKTMGWVALEFAKHHFRKQTIRLSYVTTSNNTNLLPDGVMQKDGSVIRFERKLIVDVLAK